MATVYLSARLKTDGSRRDAHSAGLALLFELARAYQRELASPADAAAVEQRAWWHRFVLHNLPGFWEEAYASTGRQPAAPDAPASPEGGAAVPSRASFPPPSDRLEALLGEVMAVLEAHFGSAHRDGRPSARSCLVARLAWKDPATAEHP